MSVGLRRVRAMSRHSRRVLTAVLILLISAWKPIGVASQKNDSSLGLRRSMDRVSYLLNAQNYKEAISEFSRSIAVAEGILGSDNLEIAKLAEAWVNSADSTGSMLNQRKHTKRLSRFTENTPRAVKSNMQRHLTT
jgi:hypothetical protein